MAGALVGSAYSLPDSVSGAQNVVKRGYWEQVAICWGASVNKWRIDINWGWRDAGNLPDEIHRGLPSELQEVFASEDEDAGSVQL